MQAVILAAGRGTRMKELTADCPKPMLRILGKPLLEWKLELLPDAIDEVIFVVGYLGNCIKEHFGYEWKGRRIRYVEQTELNGTGGAVHLVKDVVRDHFLVMMGDDLYHSSDLGDLMREETAVLGFEVAKPFDVGLVEVDDQGNLSSVVEHVTRETPGLVNTGAYLLNQRFFHCALVPISEKEFGLPQTLARMSKEVPVKVLKARAWQPIGHPEDIEKGKQFLQALGLPGSQIQ